MSSLRFLSLISALLTTMGTNKAAGDMKAPDPIPQRVARADAVIVGKVTKIEDKTIEAIPYWGGDKKVELQVAVVKVTEGLKAPKGVTHLRVAFVPMSGTGARRYPTMGLSVDSEVCLFLKQHPNHPVYLIGQYDDKIVKPQQPAAVKGFEQQVAQAKTAAKLLDDPMESLKSKDQKDRLLTAAMLIARYRTPPPFRPAGKGFKQEPIGKEESKLILKALAEIDWDQPTPPLNQYPFQPATLFNNLGVTAKDGFNPPKDYRQRIKASREWVSRNSDSYRILRFVNDK